jgi:hypothetical protein
VKEAPERLPIRREQIDRGDETKPRYAGWYRSPAELQMATGNKPPVSRRTIVGGATIAAVGAATSLAPSIARK